MEIALRLSSIQRLLIGSVALVSYAGLCAELWDDLLDLGDPYDLVEFFGLSYEENLPTWFVSSLLFSCGMSLAAIALGTRRAGGRYVGHWWGLAAAFLYISLDEVATIHEEMSNWFEFDGVLYFGWVIPAAIIVTVFALSYIGFLRALPRFYARRFVLAGALYVGGALGMELPLGYWTDLHGRDNLGYGLIDWVEESLELAGVSLFLYTLIQFLAGSTGRVELGIAEGRRTPSRSRRAVALALAALWIPCIAVCSALYLTGISEYQRYADDEGVGRDRTDYVGEHLGGVVRGGEAYRHRGTRQVFDRQGELRAALGMLLVAACGLLSAAIVLGRPRGGA